MTHISHHFQISAIKRYTDEKIVYDSLLNFTPKPAKYETLSDLFRNIEKEQRNTEQIEESNVSENKKESGFQSALQVFQENGKAKQSKIGDFFKACSEKEKSEVKTDVMGEKKSRDLKSLFGDESDSEETKKVDYDLEKEKKEKKRKHEDRHKRHEKAKRSKTEASSMDKEYEKFVEAVEINDEKSSEQNGESSNKTKRSKLKKTEIGNLVVKLLTPAYAERRFESRDTFKNTARNICHALIDKGTSKILFE